MIDLTRFTITAYDVVSARTTEELSKEVTERTRFGWVPWGSMVYNPGSMWYKQPMITVVALEGPHR